MKLDGDNGFHKLAVESILSMCMNDINGKRILKVEGCLSLTVESGEVFCIVIKEDLNSDDDKRIRRSRRQVSSEQLVAQSFALVYCSLSCENIRIWDLIMCNNFKEQSFKFNSALLLNRVR